MFSAMAPFYLFVIVVAAQVNQLGLQRQNTVEPALLQDRILNEISLATVEDDNEHRDMRNLEQVFSAREQPQVALRVAPKATVKQDLQRDTAPILVLVQHPLMPPAMTEAISVMETAASDNIPFKARATFVKRLPPPVGVATVDEPGMMTSANSPAQSSAVVSSISSLSSEIASKSAEIASKSAEASRISDELNHKNGGSIHRLINSNQLFSICSLFVALVSLSVAAYL